MNVCFCQECTGPHIFFALTHWETTQPYKERTGSTLAEKKGRWDHWAEGSFYQTSIFFGSAGWRERRLTWRCTCLTQHFDLSLCTFCIPGQVSEEGFQGFMKAGMAKPGLLCILVLWPPCPCLELLSVPSMSTRGGAMLLAVRHQSMGNPLSPLVRRYYLMHG